jgi:epoxyqueuosine reductase QueG
MASMSPEQFRSRFRGTPMARTKQAGLQRNVEVVLANRQRT